LTAPFWLARPRSVRLLALLLWPAAKRFQPQLHTRGTEKSRSRQQISPLDPPLSARCIAAIEVGTDLFLPHAMTPNVDGRSPFPPLLVLPTAAQPGVRLSSRGPA